MNIIIRVLHAGDEPVLSNVAPDVFDHATDAGLCTEFLADKRHHIAVALDGDLVVGMASAIDHVHPDKPVTLWINELGVAPAYRRRGIARRLLQALFELGRALGCKEAWVGTEYENTAARELYTVTGGRAEPFVMYSYQLRKVEDE